MKLSRWELLFGVIIISGIGIFLHYAYELSNNNQFVALIAPINESIWEHLKMAFYGMIIYALIEYIFIGKEQKNFIFAKAFTSLLACFLLAALYYGYTSFLDPQLYLDIIIFVVAILITQLFSYAIMKSKFHFYGINYISIIIIFLSTFVFCSYTYEAPQDEIFTEICIHD